MGIKEKGNNQTSHANSLRESLEHVLTYLGTEDKSELDKAKEAAKDAEAQAFTRREYVAAKYMANMAASVDSDVFQGLAR